MSDRTPPLPKQLHAQSALMAFLGCAYTVLLMSGTSWLVWLLWSSDLGAAPKIVGAIPLGIIGGYGVLLAGFMGHDGTHFTLHQNKALSCIFGILMTAPIFPYLVMGFAMTHWHHHKYTNSDRDPDAQVFGKFNSFWSRALLARPYTFYVYGTACLKLALGSRLPASNSFPLPQSTLRNLARLNLLTHAISTGLFVYLCFVMPMLGLATGYILLWGSVISGLSPYIEHDDTQTGRGRDTRTAVGWWWDLFLLGNNYHIEHHLYPTVPFYRLKAAYRFLSLEGWYDSPRHVTQGFIDTYRTTLGRYRYGA